MLSDYSKNHQLDHVIEVESNKDTLTLSGYNKSNDSLLLRIKVKLKRYDVLAINEWHSIFNKGHFKPLPISITTVPFKVRPELDEFRTNATSGITNVGLNLDLGRWKTERYFASGKKSTHKFYGGIWLAPSVEELDSLQTRGFLAKGTASKQLFISTALTLNYTYNNFTFTFVPVGFDIATSSVGKEWIYNRERWWGFGIGLEPKFFKSN
ncbi:hypothetical protein C900_02085 [Fulvivirga imtechensis AK7]|uniref:Uncharacterized protein n=2 Tax=Fulvivirga TaxID=396811 RepID=L8JX82_9BACT|nr:hypothetical protein C900_02085 [Fulvivirga imtechensis AK7]